MRSEKISHHKAIWVVGGSSGIGESLVKQLDQLDHLVFVSARSIEARAGELNYRFGRLIPVDVDVTDLESVQTALEKIKEHTDHLDMVMINAGTCEYIDSTELDLAAIKRVMDTNFFGAVHVINASLPMLRAAKKIHRTPPQLVLVSSSVTYLPLPRAGAYGASKSAIRYLIECLKLDLQHEGIDVRVVSPGFVKTPLTDKNDFPMPFRISSDQAAERILKGLNSASFDVHFPKRFTLILKTLACLPNRWRFALVGKASRHQSE